MKIAFLGSGAFGLATLRHLADAHEVLAVISQPDRPAGRGKTLTPTPISEWVLSQAGGSAMPLLRPENINEPSVTSEVHRLAAQADAWVVIAFGQKLGPTLLNPRPNMDFVGAAGGQRGPLIINLHASLLPKWRGAAPINAAMLAGDAVTGNSVITLAERMDAGLVLATSKRAIEPSQTAGELHNLLAADGPELIERVLHEYAAGRLAPVTQDESLVTKARKLSKADGWIDLAGSAEHCRRRIHGLTPWPGVTVMIDGKPVKLLRVAAREGTGASAESHPRPPHTPGVFADVAGGLVACGDGSTLQLLEVQPAGGRPMGWADFMRGRMLAACAVVTSETKPC